MRWWRRVWRITLITSLHQNHCNIVDKCVYVYKIDGSRISKCIKSRLFLIFTEFQQSPLFRVHCPKRVECRITCWTREAFKALQKKRRKKVPLSKKHVARSRASCKYKLNWSKSNLMMRQLMQKIAWYSLRPSTRKKDLGALLLSKEKRDPLWSGSSLFSIIGAERHKSDDMSRNVMSCLYQTMDRVPSLNTFREEPAYHVVVKEP